MTTDKTTTRPSAGGGKPPRKRDDVAVPSLGPLGMLRWAWTQLTSMRTALFLLLLLAVAAVPGSLFPQRSVNAAAVNDYLDTHPAAGEWLDRAQMFDVYSSVWFSAIYLLLFVSLVGCVLPRAKKHYHAVRTPPPRTPARLDRLPERGEAPLAGEADGGPSADAAVERLAALLRKRGYRAEARPGDPVPSVGAERGYLREVGNLVFHLSLVGILVSVAIGGAWGYNGQRILVEDESFVNTLVSYDAFTPGTAFEPDQLHPFSLQLEDFDVVYDRESSTHFGQPLDYTARFTVREEPGGPGRQETLKVNHPLRIGGADVYLVGNGYAPVVTVRDGNGDIAHSGPVPAVPQDSVMTSLMVLKVPDAAPDQLGFVGLLLPTAGVGANGIGISLDPSPVLPQLQLNSYYGDLGLDDGDPQNVYVLDTDRMTELNSRTLESGGLVINPGQTVQLPDGKGSITFEGLKRYVGLDIHHDPGKVPVAVFSALALLGLGVSLFVPRRRLWIKVHPGRVGGGRTIEYGLLARGEDPRLAAEAERLRESIAREYPTGADRATETP